MTMKLIKFFIEIQSIFREWYLEEMYATYGEADVPDGASFKEIKQYYDSLEA
jgi:hypothetical protein